MRRPSSSAAACFEAGERRGLEPDAKSLDLGAQPLRSLRRCRLQGERPDPLPGLLLERARPIHLDGDSLELQLGAMAPLLEASEPRGLFDERPSLDRLRGEHLLHAALSDDGVHLVAEPLSGEQLEHVGPANGGAVDEILPLAAALEAARDRDLGVWKRAVPCRVVEQELDLAVVGRLPARRAREEDVLGLLGAQSAWRQTARRPDDRVGDVRLPRAVRADDDGHARLETDLDRVRERLEAAQLDRAQIHARAV